MQIHALRLAFVLVLAYFPACHAVLVNRTIDSNKGDPVTGFTPTFLSPTPIWGDQTCAAWDPKASTGCTINPDPAKAFDGTWRATTYLPTYNNINFTLNFVGVAIWVYFILANLNEAGDPFTNTNVNFTLDGRPAGNFSHEPDNSTYALMYNSTVFSRTDLTNSPHTLLVSVNDYDRNTFVCFDWAMYTVDLTDTNSTVTGSVATPSNTTSATSSSSSSSSSSQTGIIAGSVVGGLAIIGLVIVALLWNRKRQSHQEEQDGYDPSPTPFLHASRPSQDVLSVRTQPTSEVTASSLSYVGSQSREALTGASRGGYGGGTISKRAEANYQPLSNFSVSTEPHVEAVDSAGAPVQVVAELTTQMQELRSQMEQLRNSDGAPPAYA